MLSTNFMIPISLLDLTAALPASDRLRIKEGAAIARVSVTMIYRWIGEGRFKSWTVTRTGLTRGIRYIDKTTFDAFLRSQAAPPPNSLQ